MPDLNAERERLVAAVEDAMEQFRHIPYWKNRLAVNNARVALERFDTRRKQEGAR